MPQGRTARSNADLFALASAAALLTGVVVLFLSLRPLEPATELPNGSGMGGLTRGALELSPPPASSPVAAEGHDPSESAPTLALAPVVAPAGDAQATVLATFSGVPHRATRTGERRGGDRRTSDRGPKRRSGVHGHANRSDGSDRTLAKVAGSDATTATGGDGSAPVQPPHSVGGTGRAGLPPGLAKRGDDLPPGLAKRDGHLPPGLAKR
jgi:hypothetical protein